MIGRVLERVTRVDLLFLAVVAAEHADFFFAAVATSQLGLSNDFFDESGVETLATQRFARAGQESCRGSVATRRAGLSGQRR